MEDLPQILLGDDMMSPTIGQYAAYLMFPSVTRKPVDLELTGTPEPKDVESSPAQQEAPPQPLEHTEEAEPSPTQQETSAKPPEEVEP